VPVLTSRAPRLAAGLPRREVDETAIADQARSGFMAGLVRALLATGSYY
jgi:hypothetical protein